MARIARLGLCAAALSLTLAPAASSADLTQAAVQTGPIAFDAGTWVDLQRVTGADPQVNVDMRGSGRVFVDFPWARLNRPTVPRLPNIVGRSLDRGRTFRTLSEENCSSGNSQPHCGDPGFGNSDLALSPDTDNVYLAGIAPEFTALTASASSDNGDTWPRFNLVTSPGFTDRPWLLATSGQKAHLAYSNVTTTSPGLINTHYATTTDGGQSWAVDHVPKYTTSGIATGLTMDRSPQSPARGTIYQAFGGVENALFTDEVRVAVSRDDAQTFQTYHVGDHLAASNPQGPYRGFSLPWVTTDAAGNAYAVWGTDDGGDVVISSSDISDPANDPAVGGNPGSTWSAPVRVSTGAAETAVVGNVVAGSPGHVAVVYYGTSGSQGRGIPDDQTDGEWKPFVAYSTNALTPSPVFTQSVISDRVVHSGGYCTTPSGTDCPTGSDRGLRNWMSVGFDPDGRLYTAWSDDNNDGKRTGIRFARQVAGPRLVAGRPPFSEPVPSSTVGDPSGDATWPNRITGGTNLPGVDLRRVSVSDDGTQVGFSLSVGDMRRLQEAVDAVPSAGRVLFLVRFETAEQDYFAAYEYADGGTVRAFTGRIDADDNVENGAFPFAIAFLDDDHDPATATVSGNTITITQRLSAFADPDTGVVPDRLLSVVGAAMVGPSEGAETRSALQNTLDATRAFHYVRG